MEENDSVLLLEKFFKPFLLQNITMNLHYRMSLLKELNAPMKLVMTLMRLKPTTFELHRSTL